MNNGDGRRLSREEEEEEDEEDEGNGRGLDAWERAYADDRSWESLQEDESGLLRPIDNKTLYHAQYRRRLRSLSSASTGARIQKGLIRYLYIVIDLSRVSEFYTLTHINVLFIQLLLDRPLKNFMDQMHVIWKIDVVQWGSVEVFFYGECARQCVLNPHEVRH